MPHLRGGLCLEEREVAVPDRAAKRLRLPSFRLGLFRNELRAAAAPFGTGVVGVDLREHARETGPLRKNFHSAVLELDVSHRSVSSLEASMDDELRLGLTVGADELVEGVVGGDDPPPNVEQGLGSGYRSLLFQDASSYLVI